MTINDLAFYIIEFVQRQSVEGGGRGEGGVGIVGEMLAGVSRDFFEEHDKETHEKWCGRQSLLVRSDVAQLGSDFEVESTTGPKRGR